MYASSRIVLFSILSSILFLYTLAIAYTNRLEKKQLKKIYNVYLDETSKILEDKRWISWGMPRDYIEYCILWIFQQNPNARIFFKGEIEVDYKIKTCIFEIETNSKLILSTPPPFGSIKILNETIEPTGPTEGIKATDNTNTDNTNTNNANKLPRLSRLSLEWSMSTELDESSSLKQLPKELLIHVHSIFIKKDGDWTIKINEHHLKKGDHLPWKNVEIIEVRDEHIILRINTPQETIEHKIGCNERYVVSYV